nr:hypothetical protein [Tanacetum cinerariifolium]
MNTRTLIVVKGIHVSDKEVAGNIHQRVDGFSFVTHRVSKLNDTIRGYSIRGSIFSGISLRRKISTKGTPLLDSGFLVWFHPLFPIFRGNWMKNEQKQWKRCKTTWQKRKEKQKKDEQQQRKEKEVLVIGCYSNLEAGLLERINGPDHIISTGPYRTILHGKIFGKDHQLRRLPFCFDQNLGVIETSLIPLMENLILRITTYLASLTAISMCPNPTLDFLFQMSDYDQRVQNLHGDEDIRDVHALTSPYYPHSMATSDRASRGDFSNMSVTNSTLVLAGSSIASSTVENDGASNWDYGLHPSASPTRRDSASVVTHGGREVAASVRSVRKEEVESKITAWKNAKISEINNRFKCEDAIINGWENEQAQQSTLRMKKIERKLEEKRVRAVEKMENEIAKAHQKAEERRASAEAKRGGKIARVLEVANLMKAVGRSPVKSSIF